ncbi:MAG TPA: HAD-IIA family hydrolase [Acidimicrobiia bacterium]|nr:HAD-IIA family hydrolase [Acidimicrobiia bacterium]
MNVLCDLDGVIYRGGTALPGVPDALRRLLDSDFRVFFITNNSTRTPEATAAKVTEVTGVEVSGDQILTSSQAAMTMLGPADGPVFVVGEVGLRDSITAHGLELTDDPTAAHSVVVGLTRSLTYQLLTEAMQAILNGARFIATNDDTSFPTEDGLAPGCGAIVAAIAASSATEPEVAGKPNPAMRELIRSKLDGPTWIIGDRADTDIALAAGEGDWRSILVLTGITGRESAREAGADHVVEDFPAAVDLVLRPSQQS